MQLLNPEAENCCLGGVLSGELQGCAFSNSMASSVLNFSQKVTEEIVMLTGLITVIS